MLKKSLVAVWFICSSLAHGASENGADLLQIMDRLQPKTTLLQERLAIADFLATPEDIANLKDIAADCTLLHALPDNEMLNEQTKGMLPTTGLGWLASVCGQPNSLALAKAYAEQEKIITQRELDETKEKLSQMEEQLAPLYTIFMTRTMVRTASGQEPDGQAIEVFDLCKRLKDFDAFIKTLAPSNE